MEIEKLAHRMAKIKGVQAVYLFGSWARGLAKPYSDIDICVVAEGERAKKQASALSTRWLDIVFFDELPLPIQFRVLREGRLLYAREPRYITGLTVRVCREYMDFRPRYERHIARVLA